MTIRKRDLTIPGQLDAGEASRSPITILELSEQECRILEELPELDPDASVQIWMGAVGPFRVRVSSHSRTRLEFNGHVHSAIVEHFNAQRPEDRPNAEARLPDARGHKPRRAKGRR